MSIGALKVFAIAGDGMSAQRTRMDAVSENIANAETTRTINGGPYRRQRVVFDAPFGGSDFRRELRTAELTMRRTRDGHVATLPTRGVRAGDNEAAVMAVVQTDPNAPPRMIFDPSHPDADDDGYVAVPDVDIVTEMVDLMSATRAYEANLTTIEAAKAMVAKALEI